MILSDSVDLSSPARGHSPIRRSSGSLHAGFLKGGSFLTRADKDDGLDLGGLKTEIQPLGPLGDGQETIENHRSVEGP